MLTAALAVPFALGVKVTPMLQLAFTASVVPQVLLLNAKLEALVPVSDAPMPVSDAVPVLVSVTLCAAVVVLSVPSVKVSAEADSDATGAAVPDRVTVCGDPLALSAMFSVAEKLPAPDGEKVTLMVQLALAAMPVPQVFVSPKLDVFVPVSVMPLMVIAAAPVLLNVTTCAAPLVKLSDVGEREATGTALATPVPATLMLCVVPFDELSVTVRLAERAPVAVGVKFTVMVQDALDARLVPQLFVWEKSPGFVPVYAMLEIVIAAVPVLVSVAVCDVAALFTTVEPKAMPFCGSKSASGAGAVVAVPVSVA
jgi:hypothetical protein